MFKLVRCEWGYNRVYTSVRTTEGIRKIYEGTKGIYILLSGKRKYIELPH
jgi:hypothetical protein